MLGKMVQEKEERTVVIGKATPDIEKLWDDFELLDDELDEEMDFRKKQIELEAEYTLKKEFGERIKALSVKQKAIWKKVYEVYNLDPDKSYSYNKNTKEIEMEIDEEDFPKPTLVQ